MNKKELGFNPLNQVYVFNCKRVCLQCYVYLSFNPLNQVYVFNIDVNKKGLRSLLKLVLIP